MNQSFSIVVRANAEQPMPHDRMLEGASDVVKSEFASGGGDDLEKLAQLPTVLTREFEKNDTASVAVVGYMDEPSYNPTISHPIMLVPSYVLASMGFLDGWEGKRTRWIVCGGNPFRLLASHAMLPETPVGLDVDKRLAAVMMPFDSEAALDPVYKAISEGARSAGFVCRRVDELSTPTVITDDLNELILSAGVVIADISGKNANVMYEVGYALGCGKDVVLLTSDDMATLPFDIRQRRAFAYTKTEHGLKGLSEDVEKALNALA